MNVDNEEQWHMGTHTCLATHTGNMVPMPVSAPPDLENQVTNSGDWHF